MSINLENFKQASKNADSHPDPSVRLAEFGVEIDEAVMTDVMMTASKVVVMSAGIEDLVLNVASLFMTGMSVGVELAAMREAVAAGADQ